jgi:hypothetical protein
MIYPGWHRRSRKEFVGIDSDDAKKAKMIIRMRIHPEISERQINKEAKAGKLVKN